MAELKALLFDVDGTLADTERDGHRVAFNRAFADAGLDWDWSVELYGQLLAVTGGKERIKYFLAGHRPDFQAPGDLDTFVAGLHKAKTAHYTAMLADGAVQLRPGVRRLLEETRAAGLRLAVVTTTTPENVSALLTHSLAEDGMDWFEVIAAGDIVPAKKPAPDIYIWAMDKMNLKPEECLAFEDSKNGVRSSTAAGLTTLVTVNGYTENEDLSGAAVILDQLGEPGSPFKVLVGDALGSDYVDLDFLQRLHAAHHG